MPTNGLVGWWPVNGNADDESGDAHHGTSVGASLTTDRFGGPNQAYAFSSSYIEIPPIAAINGMDDFAWSVWFRVDGNTSEGRQYLVGRGFDFTEGFSIWRGDDDRLALIVNGFNGFQQISANPAEPAQEWHHFVANRAQGVVSYYIDCVLDTAFSCPATILTSSNPDSVYFGAYKWFNQPPNYFEYFLNGELDDIGLWNRALTEGEIDGLCLAGGPCISTTPVVYSGLSASYTTLDPAVTLVASPAGGVFIGQGMSGSTFDPATAGEGTHSISYTWLDSNNCVNTYSLCTSVNIGMELEDPTPKLSGVRVYPNPNHGQFTVELELQGLVSLQVFDTRGRQVHNEVFQANGSRTQRVLDLSGLAKGGYSVQVQNAGAMVTQMVVVE
ncbi:MAG: T9SS type A sorting domain-containing protein [Flavobacteriales bacterium]|nr:T9SS type A sorting domain-containing protein [Flavobacteriales bacterium]